MTVYRNKAGQRVRPVPGSKEHRRLKASKGWTEDRNTDPPKTESTSSGSAEAPKQEQVEKGPEKPAEGERRTATARGTAKIRTGGGSK
jgi:hypothetical protein